MSAVYAAEPNCLSYEFCDAEDNPFEAIIYERYVQRRHLDEDHQTTLARWRESSSDKLKALGEVKLTLTHYTESNIGHMDR
eukprot:CAMPEP_0181213158 /NCGR_PEP_ID=MMETSP1096-20121128/24749_1 /TAXON_ID=156174 ORGANISM="Chrysochromulina ericina, Strain CCMP281" /NCGR_SAMPLE_ID=MMETSP1096 /ASSEMBLY_ACC=CAM_ASM_000453 /LENGTH=80 /DNA_ID=CAMNT_0023304765 /DNA_START=83 /DNA_END=325 /DNA_ORIENTATION=-